MPSKLLAVPSELAKNPAGHRVYAKLFWVLVGIGKYLPTGQSLHAVTPGVPENFPAGHAVHVPVAVEER
jgi:hypothetical protein